MDSNNIAPFLTESSHDDDFDKKKTQILTPKLLYTPSPGDVGGPLTPLDLDSFFQDIIVSPNGKNEDSIDGIEGQIQPLLPSETMSLFPFSPMDLLSNTPYGGFSDLDLYKPVVEDKNFTSNTTDVNRFLDIKDSVVQDNRKCGKKRKRKISTLSSTTGSETAEPKRKRTKPLLQPLIIPNSNVARLSIQAIPLEDHPTVASKTVGGSNLNEIIQPPPTSFRQQLTNVQVSNSPLLPPFRTPTEIERIGQLRKIRKVNETGTLRNNWKCIHGDERVDGLIEPHIFTRTRCETWCEKVPEEIYSSLKYTIRSRLKVKRGHIENKCQVKLPNFVAKIRVVDTTDGNEIKKQGKAILSGKFQDVINNQSDMAIPRRRKKKTVTSEDIAFERLFNDKRLKKERSEEGKEVYDGFFNFQFTDVSFHHKRHQFRFEIMYFLPGRMNTPVMIMRSTPFRVYARKPADKAKANKKKKKVARKKKSTTTNNNSNRKRKRRRKRQIDEEEDEDEDDDYDDEDISPLPRRRRQQQNQQQQQQMVSPRGLTGFTSRLDDLISTTKNMSENEKREAVKMVYNRLLGLGLDPNYFKR